MRILKIALLCLLALTVCGLACAPSYVLNPPEAFKPFKQINTFQFITADGVMLKGREVENEPVAPLDFWQDALKLHMEKNGYVLKSEQEIETGKKLKGHNFAFLLPYGAEDWIFNVTIFVRDEVIYILEVAGPYDRYTKIEADLTASLSTFDPDGDQ